MFYVFFYGRNMLCNVNLDNLDVIVIMLSYVFLHVELNVTGSYMFRNTIC